jgi:hypothetical protein
LIAGFSLSRPAGGDLLVSGTFSALVGGQRLLGESTGDGRGTVVVGGDVDRDGTFDLLMGTPRSGSNDDGAVWLLRGSSL